MWTVSKEFRFEAAHSLPHLPETHKCHHVHGHSYKVVIHCSGWLHKELHWVVDYAEISKVVSPLIKSLDHKNLNDILPNPTTAEEIAFWFYMTLRDTLPVSCVEVYETPTSCCSYEPEHIFHNTKHN